MTTTRHSSRRLLAALVATLALGGLGAPAALAESPGGGEAYIPFVTDFPKPGPVGGGEEYIPFVTDFPEAQPGSAAFDTGLVTRPLQPEPSAVGSGLAWDDVGIGVGMGLGLAVVLAGATLALRGRRQPAAHH